jgi:DNA-binding CsgD family transcriptional regulator
MHDLSPVLEVLAAAESARDRAALRVRTVDALASLLPCDHVLWGELDVRRMWPVAAVTSDRTEVDLASFGRHAASHPLVAHHLRTGDTGPLRLSDFVGQHALRRLGVWADFYRPLDVRHALCVALPGTGVVGIGIAFHRSRRDFDDDEVALLARVRPALAVAVREVTWAAEMPGPLTTREAQVLRLVVLGASNGEVGLALRISPRTVEKHLEHVYRKLGVSGRYGAMASARSSSVRP